VRLSLGMLAAGVAALAGCGGGSGGSSSSASVGAASSGAATSQSTPSGGSQTSHSAASPTDTTPAPAARLARGFHLSSPAFHSDGPIPRQYTCDGSDLSPPLRISGVPAAAKELVLVMRDPDAPSGNFVHWALAAVPPGTTQLRAGGVPGQIIPGRNSFGSLGYKGPCPPRGDKPHHYVISLNALSGPSGLKPGFTADELQTAAVAIATLTGTYRRH
jgi:Raf kinase inhibitor-like YbhB/YbcL family protein